jgi:hypothetical protein
MSQKALSVKLLKGKYGVCRLDKTDSRIFLSKPGCADAYSNGS